MKNYLALGAAAAALTFAGSAFADSNSVFIDQMGDDNISVADQIGTGNTADYYVDGKRNEIGTGNGNTPAHHGPLQKGDNLTLKVRQVGNDNRAGTWAIDQRGNGNTMDFTQGDYGNKGFGNTIGFAQQRTSDNKMTTAQYGSENALGNLHQGGGTGNRMNLTQDGTRNGQDDVFSNITAVFDGTVDYGSMSGVKGAKQAQAYQMGDGNRMTVDQSGTGNSFDLRQGWYDERASYTSTFNLNQTGSYNYTYGRQYDTNQLANVNQNGFGNVAVVSQKLTALTPAP